VVLEVFLMRAPMLLRSTSALRAGAFQRPPVPRGSDLFGFSGSGGGRLISEPAAPPAEAAPGMSDACVFFSYSTGLSACKVLPTEAARLTGLAGRRTGVSSSSAMHVWVRTWSRSSFLAARFSSGGFWEPELSPRAEGLPPRDAMLTMSRIGKRTGWRGLALAHGVKLRCGSRWKIEGGNAICATRETAWRLAREEQITLKRAPAPLRLPSSPQGPRTHMILAAKKQCGKVAGCIRSSQTEEEPEDTSGASSFCRLRAPH